MYSGLAGLPWAVCADEQLSFPFVERLRTGELVRQIEAPGGGASPEVSATDRNEKKLGLPTPRPSPQSPGYGSSVSPLLNRFRLDDPRTTDWGAGELVAAEKRLLLEDVLTRAIQILEPVNEWNDALSWLKAYKTLPASGGSPELRGGDLWLHVSRDSDFALDRLNPGVLLRIRALNRPLASLISDERLQGFLRSSWSNEDLETLLYFQRMREQALSRCTELLWELTFKHANGVLAQHSDIDRVKVLLGWSSLVGLVADPAALQADSQRFTSATRLLAWVLGKLGLSGDARFDDIHSVETKLYIRALSLLIVPSVAGRDVHAAWSAPILPGWGLVSRLESEGLGKSQQYLRDWQDTYRSYRDRDQPELPVHPAPHPDAAHVVFIDTGIDWETYPDLGLFMGLGRDGELSQRDLADGDDNPWVPAVGDLAHGSGVVATLLTVLAHQNPRLLEERKLDIAMWKAASLRSLLSNGSNPDLRRFDLRQELSFGMGFWKLHQQATASPIPRAARPDIVSISASYPIRSRLGTTAGGFDLRKGDWVWVMAAGNGSSNLDQRADHACMGDVPEDERPSNKLICVGALKKGILRDSIARYSNYGQRVDVYAHESASGLCPSGTSCSTPAVTAGLTMLKAKYPMLNAEQLKRVLIEASSERQVEQEIDGKKSLVKVRVFDPSNMMNKAYSIAARAVRGLSQ